MIDPDATLADALATLSAEELDALAKRSTETRRDATPEPRSEVSLGGVEAIETLADLSDGDALTVHGTLGVGGMAVVRLGRQERMGRMVAVKTLRDDRTGGSARVRLLREAWVTGRLEHPNIVPVYDVRLDDGGDPLVVLKRIAGVDWEVLLEHPDQLADFGGAADPLAWHVRVLVTVCHAVQFAHDQGILHRDIKPSNVMIGRYGEALLLDWGIAVSLGDDATGRMPVYRKGVAWAGTPAYMAPEMLERSDVPQSRATDVYLLGAVLFRLLTGRAPHQGPDAEAMLLSVLGPAPVVPSDESPILAEVCRAALDPDPERRPASAAAFRAELESFLERRAAAGLTDAAEEKLAELRAASGLDLAEHSRLAAACKFGFQQALAIDPDYTRAQEGLRACLLLVAEHALDCGQLATVRTLLEHIADPPAALLARFESAVAAEEAREAEFARLRLDEDASAGGWARTVTQLVLGLLVTVGGVIIARSGGGEGSFGPPLGLVSALLATMLAFRVALHRTVFQSRYNRRTWGILVVMAATVLVNDLRHMAVGLPPFLAHSQHPMIFGAGFAALGAAVDARYALASVGYGAVLLASLVRPEWQNVGMAPANGFMVLASIRVWMSAMRPKPDAVAPASPPPHAAPTMSGSSTQVQAGADSIMWARMAPSTVKPPMMPA